MSGKVVTADRIQRRVLALLLVGSGCFLGCQGPVPRDTPHAGPISSTPVRLTFEGAAPVTSTHQALQADLYRASVLLEQRIPRHLDESEIMLTISGPDEATAGGGRAIDGPHIRIPRVDDDVPPALAYLRHRHQRIAAIGELTELWCGSERRGAGPDPRSIGTWIALETLGPDRGQVPVLANALAVDAIRRRVDDDDDRGALRIYEWSRPDGELAPVLQPLFLAYLYRHLNRDDERFRQTLTQLNNDSSDIPEVLVRQLARMDDQSIDDWITRIETTAMLPAIDYSLSNSSMMYDGDSRWLIDPRHVELLLQLGQHHHGLPSTLAAHQRIIIHSPSSNFSVAANPLPGGGVDIVLTPVPGPLPTGPLVFELIEDSMVVIQGGQMIDRSPPTDRRTRLIHLTTNPAAEWPPAAVLTMEFDTPHSPPDPDRKPDRLAGNELVDDTVSTPRNSSNEE